MRLYTSEITLGTLLNETNKAIPVISKKRINEDIKADMYEEAAKSWLGNEYNEFVNNPIVFCVNRFTQEYGNKILAFFKENSSDFKLSLSIPRMTLLTKYCRKEGYLERIATGVLNYLKAEENRKAKEYITKRTLNNQYKVHVVASTYGYKVQDNENFHTNPDFARYIATRGSEKVYELSLSKMYHVVYLMTRYSNLNDFHKSKEYIKVYKEHNGETGLFYKFLTLEEESELMYDLLNERLPLEYLDGLLAEDFKQAIIQKGNYFMTYYEANVYKVINDFNNTIFNELFLLKDVTRPQFGYNPYASYDELEQQGKLMEEWRKENEKRMMFRERLMLGDIEIVVAHDRGMLLKINDYGMQAIKQYNTLLGQYIKEVKK